MPPVSYALLRAGFILALIAVFWLALQPAPDIAPIVSWQDKVEHALLFAALLWLGRRAWPDRLLALVAGLLAYGAAMEVAQSFTAYRFGDILDWIADAGGLLLAALVLHTVSRQRPITAEAPATDARSQT